MVIKCIKHLCPMFFSSDYIEKCTLEPADYVCDECRLNIIQDNMDAIIAKVSTLMTRYNRLAVLEDFIRDQQPL